MPAPLRSPRWFLAAVLAAAAHTAPAAPAVAPAREAGSLRVVRFTAREPIARAGRACTLVAVIENAAERSRSIAPDLALPAGMRVRGGNAPRRTTLAPGARVRREWSLAADRAVCGMVRLRTGAAGAPTPDLLVRFLEPMPVRRASGVPAPHPVRTEILVGAHNCPLWESDKPYMWANILKHPERTPVLGFYSQENPEVADWETKWAVEHGVSFFIYCWYRSSQGGPVQQSFGSAIHQGLFRSKHRRQMRYTIMWENQSRGRAGVADEHDLMANLLPYWINTYFKDPGYLKVDGKPILFIYRPEFLIDDLGGEAKVVRAFDRMRQACRDAGFAGLTLLGEYRGHDAEQLRLMKRIGLDNTFAYCWYIPDSPKPMAAVASQIAQIRQTQAAGILPQVTTVSQAWSGWADEGSIWKIPPREFETLLRQAKAHMATIPRDQLGSRMLILDNWNEWGEGHYLAPYREYGFGYLDAIRRVFAPDAGSHIDLIPGDVGRGPYDRAIRTAMEREERLEDVARTRVVKPGAGEPGLIGWWTFDEPVGEPAALDWSGHRLGGALHRAKRVPGISGRALACDGGCVLVGDHRALDLAAGLTVECWVRTDRAGQPNNWFVNRVYAGGTATGYRLGLVDGKPCFEVPQTDWSHHLSAPDPLPVGRWVHVAGTYDGSMMRLYVDGVERGAMERRGTVVANRFHLCLGSFEVDHPAYFSGLLDEVRLYSRALSAPEIAAHHRALAGR